MWLEVLAMPTKLLWQKIRKAGVGWSEDNVRKGSFDFVFEAKV